MGKVRSASGDRPTTAPLRSQRASVARAQAANGLHRPSRLIGARARAHPHSGTVDHPGLVEPVIGLGPLVLHPQAGGGGGQPQGIG